MKKISEMNLEELKELKANFNEWIDKKIEAKTNYKIEIIAWYSDELGDYAVKTNHEVRNEEEERKMINEVKQDANQVFCYRY